MTIFGQRWNLSSHTIVEKLELPVNVLNQWVLLTPIRKEPEPMLSRLVCCLLPIICVVGLRAGAEEPRDAKLPLKRVVLFSSGVGFFEHSGKVQDDAKVEMKFKVGDINDLLKSMVVQDLDGGQVSTVTYGSKDPITKTLEELLRRSDGQPHLGPTPPTGPRRAGHAQSRPTSKAASSWAWKPARRNSASTKPSTSTCSIC